MLSQGVVYKVDLEEKEELHWVNERMEMLDK
jgi:hypothetical protein